MNTLAAKRPSLDFDLQSLESIGEHLGDHLDAIREADPIFWSDIQKGWFVTRFQDVVDGFMGKYPLSNVRLDKLAFASIPESEGASRIPLLTSATPTFTNMMDPPRHTFVRRTMAPAFTPKTIQAMRPFVQRRVKELLDWAEEEREFEFIEGIARPLTGSVIMEMMGVPEEYLGQLREWAFGVVNAIGTPRPSAELLESGEAAMRAMDDLFTQEIAKRHQSPTSDFLSAMAKATQGEDGLSHAEVLGNCVNALLAGHESTASTLAFGTDAFAKYPDQVSYMLSHPDEIQNVLAEIGRYILMSACMTRVATADFEWGGKQIKKGDVVYLWMAAGGRDPSVVSNPRAFDVSRPPVESLVFGRGIHFCIGHMLAKLELGEFFLAAFSRFKIEVLDNPLDYSGSYSFRTVSTMNVRFTPR